MPTNVSEEPIYQDTRRHIREDRHIDPTLSERRSHDEYQTYVRGGRVDSEGSLPAVRACVCVCVYLMQSAAENEVSHYQPFPNTVLR